MTWVRWGDTSANHPIVLSVLEHDECDDRLVNEVHGFVSRCSAQSGSHLTDYVITRGTAVLIAGPTRVDFLLDVAVFAGYMTGPHLLDDGRKAWKLVDDDPDFLHLRLREEVEFERQRRRDNSNPALIVPVRIRDGDACRWCGRIVDWGSRKASRSGTYDHLVPGQAATIDTYIVSCQGCNSSRKDGSRPRNADQLYPEPVAPYYSDRTIEWLTDNEWRRRQNLPVPPRSRRKLRPGDLAPGLTERDTVTPANKATAGTRPDTQPGNDHTNLDTDTQSARPVTPAQRPDTSSGNATSPRPDTQSGSDTPDAENHPMVDVQPTIRPAETPVLSEIRRLSADPAEHEGTESVRTGRVGSGRVGTGLVGSPTQAGTQPDTPTPSRSRRRRRARKNSRSRTTGDRHAH
ncbi:MULTISPECIES: hypothetical protein [Rhodococcus]|uniref:hypothetical protein n=1 Tax=Rhodococcus TaxID=1827 RepID=UPI001E59ECE1|nr:MULTISPECIES: hypothetical protein [Rhodococcus]BDB58959.1 hypothetical protein RDE2_07530 [Rhodococcus sp. RDE2]